MRWAEVLLELQAHLTQYFADVGVDLAGVYLGAWSSVPTQSCVHVLRGDVDFKGMEGDGGYNQTFYLFNWAAIDPTTVDYSDPNAGHRIGYDLLDTIERTSLKALRDYKRSLADRAESVDFSALRLESSPDDFAPSYASCITFTVRIWDEDLC